MLRSNLHKAQERMKMNVDRKRKEQAFSVGKKVFLGCNHIGKPLWLSGDIWRLHPIFMALMRWKSESMQSLTRWRYRKGNWYTPSSSSPNWSDVSAKYNGIDPTSNYGLKWCLVTRIEKVLNRCVQPVKNWLVTELLVQQEGWSSEDAT